MNAQECHDRAAHCAANAAISPTETIALEFLTLAAHWRSMAVRSIFLGNLYGDGVIEAPSPLLALALDPKGTLNLIAK